MKPKITVYAYKNNQFIRKFDSIYDASKNTADNPLSIKKVMDGERQITRRGFVYSKQPLTEEQINKLPTLEDDEDNTTFFMERSKNKRKQQLKIFIYQRLEQRWMTIPKNITKMEQQFIKELLESL